MQARLLTELQWGGRRYEPGAVVDVPPALIAEAPWCLAALENVAEDVVEDVADDSQALVSAVATAMRAWTRPVEASATFAAIEPKRPPAAAGKGKGKGK